jgi:hypothetical protein
VDERGKEVIISIVRDEDDLTPAVPEAIQK